MLRPMHLAPFWSLDPRLEMKYSPYPIASIGIGLVLVFIGPIVSPIAAILGAALLIIGGGALGWPYVFRPRKRYSLKHLELIDNELRAEADEEDFSFDHASVWCPHCGHHYGSDIPVCPNCKRMP